MEHKRGRGVDPRDHSLKRDQCQDIHAHHQIERIFKREVDLDHEFKKMDCHLEALGDHNARLRVMLTL